MTNKPVDNPVISTTQEEKSLNNDKIKHIKHVPNKLFIKIIVCFLIVLIAVTAIVFAVMLLNKPKPYDPVPVSIRKTASYNIYYPNPKLLPKGYTLDLHSFESTHQAILYYVTYGNGQRLIFTLQKEPSPKDIAGFYKAHMPLTISVNTKVGQAQIGVLNNETVISLPTTTNTWILMTAPLKNNQNDINKVLQSITLAQ